MVLVDVVHRDEARLETLQDHLGAVAVREIDERAERGQVSGRTVRGDTEHQVLGSAIVLLQQVVEPGTEFVARKRRE
jgi:hypothetical protein